MPSSQKLKKIKTTNITANSFFPLEMNTRSIKDSRWLVVGAVCSDSYDTFDVRMCDDKNGGVLLLPTWLCESQNVHQSFIFTRVKRNPAGPWSRRTDKPVPERITIALKFVLYKTRPARGREAAPNVSHVTTSVRPYHTPEALSPFHVFVSCRSRFSLTNVIIIAVVSKRRLI